MIVKLQITVIQNSKCMTFRIILLETVKTKWYILIGIMIIFEITSFE